MIGLGELRFCIVVRICFVLLECVFLFEFLGENRFYFCCGEEVRVDFAVDDDRGGRGNVVDLLDGPGYRVFHVYVVRVGSHEGVFSSDVGEDDSLLFAGGAVSLVAVKVDYEGEVIVALSL